MYEKHFALQQKPFKSMPRGNDVYAGAAAGRLATALRSAMAFPDAVFLITGNAGTGKTTLAGWALQKYFAQAEIIRLPRACLGHDEVLDFLLEKLGASAVPAGVLRKVILCKQLIEDRNQASTPVCILLEDANRIGEDGLIELENLTSAAGEHSSGAQLLLLGEPQLDVLLRSAAMERLLQRVRGRFRLEPLDNTELAAYLTHCFASTGRSFADLFAPGSADLLFELTAGTPRLLNTLVESLLAAAARENKPLVELPLIRQIAAQQHGLEVTATAVVAEPASEKQTSAALYATLPDLNKLAPGLAGNNMERPARANPADTLPAKPPTAEPVPPAARAAATDTLTDSDAIPTLFSSTRMQAPIADTEAVSDAATVPQVSATASAADVRVAAEAEQVTEQPEQSESNEPPEWERDPTLAELRPDLEALELAMAQFAEEEPPKKPATTSPDPVVELKDPTFMGVPEITLDFAIREKIAEATEALQKHDATIAENEIAEAPKPRPGVQQAPAAGVNAKPQANAQATERPRAASPVASKPVTQPARPTAAKPAPSAKAVPKPAPADQAASRSAPPKTAQQPVPPAAQAGNDFEQLAAGIANARTLEDVDDRMAETLFGEEFSAIAAQVAAQVAANPPPAEVDGTDEDSLELELVADEVANDSDADEVDGVETVYEREFREVYGEQSMEVSLQSDTPRAGLDLSASQRLATVRALNAHKGTLPASAANKVPPAGASSAKPPRPAATPQPIEEQISTSMTQTLRALSSRPSPANDDDDDAPKGGFFSRFKRS